jgi:hypothetical protein
MNWQNVIDQVLATTATDEAKCFALGMFLAAGVRIIRAGIRWLKAVSSE